MLRVLTMASSSGVVALALCGAASAGSVSFTGTNGSNHTARATFDYDQIGSTLSITLENLGGDVMAPADLLTTVFWDLTPAGQQGQPTLTPLSAMVSNGSSLVFGNGATNLSMHWAFRDDINHGSIGQQYGISSTGLGIFGQGDAFNGTGSRGHGSPDYGITSQNDNLSTGNNQVTGFRPIIKHSMTFNFEVEGLFDLSWIDNVHFLYGTSLDGDSFGGTPDQPNNPPDNPPLVPLPAPVWIAASGLALVGIARRRRIAASR